jgi:hypothetical protein
MKKDKAMDSDAVAATLAAERQAAEQQDDGVLGSILGLLGGAAQPAPAQEQSSTGGILGMLGGLFGGKKNK